MPTRKTGVMINLVCGFCKSTFERDAGLQRKKKQTCTKQTCTKQTCTMKNNADCCSRACAARLGKATGLTAFSIRI